VGPALFAALVVGVVVGVAVIARLGVEAGRKTAVPFGPFLALGGVLGLLAGEPAGRRVPVAVRLAAHRIWTDRRPRPAVD
jgi:prepilin signal peptidase PulO-like enzyme (type II secretory pathway)